MLLIFVYIYVYILQLGFFFNQMIKKKKVFSCIFVLHLFRDFGYTKPFVYVMHYQTYINKQLIVSMPPCAISVLVLYLAA